MTKNTQQTKFVNKQIDKYLAKSVEDVNGSVCTQHTAQIMLLACFHASCPGCHRPKWKKMPPFVFKPGNRVGAEVYKKFL